MIDIVLEYVACNLCGASESRLFYEGPDRRFDPTSGIVFRLVECTSCGLIYLNPRPDMNSLAAFYPPFYYEVMKKPRNKPPASGLRGLNDRLWGWIVAKQEREKRMIVTRLRPQPGRLLDVGCSTGNYLASMKQAGWRVAGVEWNCATADYARQTVSAEIQTGDLASCSWPDASFDVITLWHVLEHLPDPRGSLGQLQRMLRPGGYVVVLVPSARDVEFWLLGGLDSNPVDVPRHLYHFSPGPLARLMERSGLQPRVVKKFTWNTTPRLTGALQQPVIDKQPTSEIGRAARSGYLLGTVVIGMFAAAIAGWVATAGPSFVMAGRKPD